MNNCYYCPRSAARLSLAESAHDRGHQVLSHMIHTEFATFPRRLEIARSIRDLTNAWEENAEHSLF